MDSTSPPVIVCAADDRFAMPLAVTFYSVLAHLDAPERAVLFALDAGVSARSRRRVRRVVQRHGGTLEWIPLDPDRLADLPGNRWLPQASYARLFIPQLLPERFDKAIYLDCDTLVLENLRRLWARPVGGHSHLAVQDLGQPYVSSPEGVPDYETLGLPADAQYFNAGLMVMNLRRWRAERIGAQVMRYVQRHDPNALRFLDQTALNAVLAGQWGELDPRWNQMHGIYEYASWEHSPFSQKRYTDLIERPHIIHYTFTGKPWKPGRRHPEQRRYLRYLKASGWFGRWAWHGWRARHALLTAKRVTRVRTRLRTLYRRVRGILPAYPSKPAQ